MVALVATGQKSRKRASSLPFECRHVLGESRTFPAAPALCPRALAVGLGVFTGHGHHGHHGHP